MVWKYINFFLSIISVFWGPIMSSLIAHKPLVSSLKSKFKTIIRHIFKLSLGTLYLSNVAYIKYIFYLSKTCLFSGFAVKVPVISSKRSAKVLFPWSIWAIMLKLRMFFKGISSGCLTEYLSPTFFPFSALWFVLWYLEIPKLK